MRRRCRASDRPTSTAWRSSDVREERLWSSVFDGPNVRLLPTAEGCLPTDLGGGRTEIAKLGGISAGRLAGDDRERYVADSSGVRRVGQESVRSWKSRRWCTY